MIVESRKFSLFNAEERNNKFWNITLFDNGDVEVHYGSQGNSGQRKTHHGVGRTFFEKKIRDKTKSSHEGGAYVENKVLDTVQSSSSSAAVVSKHTLAQKAVRDIGADQPELKSLITYFATVNAHNIYEASGGQITYDTSLGTFQTTQGVINLDQIQEARRLLNEIERCAARSDFVSQQFKFSINPYLSLIPQKGLVRQMDFRSMFSVSGGLQRQNDILDGLESSYATVIANAQKGPGVVQEAKEERLFRVKLEVADKNEFQKVHKYYNDSKGGHHDVASYDTKAVWRLTIEHMAEAFAKKVSEMEKRGHPGANILILFHGSSCANILSILKAGFVLPRSIGSVYVTGAMFGGPGAYLSDQSTKSLRYATGAWGGSGSRDRKFMFLVNTAMGKMYTPRGPFSGKPPKEFDSTFAKAGYSGVQNNEMVVYCIDQINPVYLAEFTPYGK